MAAETANRLTFEAGNTKAFDGIELGKSDQLSVVDHPAYPGKKVARILQRPGDLWMGKYVRCLCAKYDTNERAGQHYRYVISAVFLSEFGPYGNNLLWELHHRSNLYNLDKLGVAPIAIDAQGGEWTGRVQAGKGTVGLGYATRVHSAFAPIKYDRRVDFGVDLLLGEDSGHFYIYLNDSGVPDEDMFSKPPVWKHDGPTLPYSNSGAHVGDAGLYQELGIYSGASSVSSVDGLILFGSIREEGSSDMKAAIHSIGTAGPTPPPDTTPPPGTTPLVIVAGGAHPINAGDVLEKGAVIDWTVESNIEADSCEYFVDGASVHKETTKGKTFVFAFTVPDCKTLGVEVKAGAQTKSFKAFPVTVHTTPLPPPPPVVDVALAKRLLVNSLDVFFVGSLGYSDEEIKKTRVYHALVALGGSWQRKK